MLHDREARFRLFVADRDETGHESLCEVADLPLSGPVPAEVTG